MERRKILIGGMVLAATGTAASVYKPKRPCSKEGPMVVRRRFFPEPVDPSSSSFFGRRS
jgi:hypothetical protein